MILTDENKIILMNMFCCLDFAIFSAYCRLKFSVKIVDVCLKHIIIEDT